MALTMFAMKYAIIVPIYKFYQIDVAFSKTGFMFLVLAAMLIMAAGNVINDYFDRKTDIINRPKKVLVGFKINRRKVILMHLFLSLLGVISGFIASYIMGKTIFGFFFIFVVILLWLYSTKFKKSAFVGNFTVALLTALITFIVAVSEYISVVNTISEWDINYVRAVKISLQTIIGFSIFAFLYNFIREIIKDCEDYDGDIVTGVKSIPVIIGKKKTNYIIFGFTLFSIVALIIGWHAYLSKLMFFKYDNISQWYIYALIILPSIFICVKTFISTNKKNYSSMSKLAKIIMIFGVLYSIIFSFAIYGKF
jgi:4-hydroxybenzoate polyprenyltransferase